MVEVETAERIVVAIRGDDLWALDKHKGARDDGFRVLREHRPRIEVAANDKYIEEGVLGELDGQDAIWVKLSDLASIGTAGEVGKVRRALAGSPFGFRATALGKALLGGGHPDRLQGDHLRDLLQLLGGIVHGTAPLGEAGLLLFVGHREGN